VQWVLSTRPPDWRLAIHDLVARDERVGHAFSVTQTDQRTGAASERRGIAVVRFVGGQLAEIWLAPRSADAGPWPHLACTRAQWSIAEDPLSSTEAAIAAAMARYFEIRQTREADGLRDLFVDPMVVHGPSPTRAESLEEFISRVATS
jgi:hypothetical protein